MLVLNQIQWSYVYTTRPGKDRWKMIILRVIIGTQIFSQQLWYNWSDPSSFRMKRVYLPILKCKLVQEVFFFDLKLNYRMNVHDKCPKKVQNFDDLKWVFLSIPLYFDPNKNIGTWQRRLSTSGSSGRIYFLLWFVYEIYDATTISIASRQYFLSQIELTY